jgi:hypothetical protein
VKGEFKLGVNRPRWSEPGHCLRNRQHGGMRKVNCYRMSEMTDAAVLVLKLTVPVPGGLKRQR